MQPELLKDLVEFNSSSKKVHVGSFLTKLVFSGDMFLLSPFTIGTPEA